jgi:hypothetical protein
MRTYNPDFAEALTPWVVLALVLLFFAWLILILNSRK